MLEPLSREFLLDRGFCCKNKCLNCPYKKEKFMNFKEWSKLNIEEDRIEGYFLETKDYSKLAWEACKNEVLKIIDNHDLLVHGEEKKMRQEIENL